MRATGWIVLVLIAGLSCAKNEAEPEPVYTTADGTWTYTTPDKKIKVEFELKTSATGELEIKYPATIEVNEVPGEAAGVLTNVDLPEIEQIRINANNAVHVQPYSITFTDCSVNGKFDFISVGNAEYTYPWGQLKSHSGVSITRK